MTSSSGELMQVLTVAVRDTQQRPWGSGHNKRTEKRTLVQLVSTMSLRRGKECRDLVTLLAVSLDMTDPRRGDSGLNLISATN